MFRQTTRAWCSQKRQVTTGEVSRGDATFLVLACFGAKKGIASICHGMGPSIELFFLGPANVLWSWCVALYTPEASLGLDIDQ